MAVSILRDTQGREVMYCDTMDWAFGPVHRGEESLRDFVRYLPKDPRSYAETELETLYGDWLRGMQVSELSADPNWISVFCALNYGDLPERIQKHVSREAFHRLQNEAIHDMHAATRSVEDDAGSDERDTARPDVTTGAVSGSDEAVPDRPTYRRPPPGHDERGGWLSGYAPDDWDVNPTADPPETILCECCQEHVSPEWIGATDSGDPWCYRCIAEDLRYQIEQREEADG